ncbi:hypothetical protein C2845_PM11G18200 [Panicum miliaceum]|uniref:Uncharacterized protein n=1 Tax=Panicum miliaceum TaxID=4540 RepID=A0A3L6RS26_PANMI|nr:hypothetical protein C2845_PM11G18200 [Panicum miliaceum]
MCYPGYEREIELPCPNLSLYSVKKLLLQMQMKEPARHSVAGPTTQQQVRLGTQQEQAGPSHQAGTSYMNFEQTYEYYTHRGTSTAGGSKEYDEEQGPYYRAGMHVSYGPQVGPSSSAPYKFEDPIMQGIMDIMTRITNLGQ